MQSAGDCGDAAVHHRTCKPRGGVDTASRCFKSRRRQGSAAPSSRVAPELNSCRTRCSGFRHLVVPHCRGSCARWTYAGLNSALDQRGSRPRAKGTSSAARLRLRWTGLLAISFLKQRLRTDLLAIMVTRWKTAGFHSSARLAYCRDTRARSLACVE